MPFTKDLIIATTVLVGCCLVLFLTLSEPSGGQSGTVDIPGGPELAMGGDQPTPPPPDEPPSPPRAAGGGFTGSGGSGLDFGVFDGPEEPEDEPLVATVDTPPVDSGSGRSTTFGSGPRLDANPFSDPSLTGDPLVTSPAPVPPEPIARPAPTPPRGGGSGGRSHTVASGETLMDISFKYFGTHHKWREIASANQVEPDTMVVGTVLTIPDLQAVVPAAAQGSSRGDGTYVVKQGDSYYTIARDLLGDSSRFQELERMNSIDPYDLMPGDVVKLPAGARVPSTGTASPSLSAAQPKDLPSGGRWHVVEEGEILGHISSRYYGTSKRWREIADANGISDPAQLKAGQKLVIPAAGSSSSTPTPSSRPAATTGRGDGSWYIVQKGDLLETIARRQLGDGSKWRAIVAANPGLDPRRLKVGEKVWLPAAAQTSAAVTAPPSRSTSTPSRSTTTSSGSAGSISWPDLDSNRNSGNSGNSGSGSPFDRIEP